MKQRAHAWVALRALRLIDDSKRKNAKLFVELMSYYLSDVWDGAWLPDILIRDMSYGHIFKLGSDDKFVPDISTLKHRKVTYSELKKKTYGRRLCLEEYLKDSEVLRKSSWVTQRSGHLPDRVIALNHSIIDMLKMGDFPIAFYLKKKKSKAYRSEDLSRQKIKGLSVSPNFSARQIALTFFIVSHYICDAHMPLHCDLRDMNALKVKESGRERRLPRALHPGIEKVWEESLPDKEVLTIHDYTPESIESVTNSMPSGSLIKIDEVGSPYALSTHLPSNLPNEWDEMVNICRISYAVSRKWIPQPLEDIKNILGEEKCKARAPALSYDDIISITGEDEFKDITNRIFHDAVESVARIWYRAWNIFTK
jgi:hypothetical protein